MEWYVAGAGIVSALVFLIALGIPIPFAMVAASLPFLWIGQDFSMSVATAEMMLWKSWDSYILVSIPLFIFLGDIVAHSAIGTRLYDAMHRSVPVRGAAAYGTVGACAGFGAVCGSSMIGAMTIGRVALPEMLRLGYSSRLASGVIAAGGTLSVLIPPSLILIFYGVMTDQSIGRLFIAGVIPGIILTVLFAVVVLVWGLVSAKSLPTDEGQTGQSMAAVAAGLLPPLVIGVVIFGSLYFGIATPTEAAAIAVLLTVFIAATFGGLTWKGLTQAMWSSVQTLGFLGVLLFAAVLFGFVLDYYRIPQELTSTVSGANLSPYSVLALVLLFLIIIGMFLEPMAIAFIVLPALAPMVKAAGFDMIWFGILFTLTMEIAVLTPPVGINLYVLQSMAPDKVTIGDVVLGSLPFILAMVLLIGLIILVPDLAMWLVRKMSA